MRLKSALWLLLSLFAAATAWTYMSKVVMPWQYYMNVKSGKLKEEMGDLYSRWVGTRELFLHGLNPYGPEVSHEIQMAFYGRPIDQNLKQTGVRFIDEQRFAYPIYVVFFLAPTIHTDFAQVQAWAPLVLGILVAAAVVIWMEALRWRPPKLLALAIILFVLACPQTTQGLRLRQLGFFVAFLLAACVWCMTRNHPVIAGALLAISTIKPQMVVLPVVCFLIWGTGAWPKRWPFLAAFAGMLAVLSGLGEFVLPGWPRYFAEGIVAYSRYTFPTISLLRFVGGDTLGTVASAVVIAAVLIFAWQSRDYDAASDDFLHRAAIYFVAPTLALPIWAPFNQILLLLPILLILRDWQQTPRLPRRILALIVAWPWIASAVLLLHLPDVNSRNRLPLLPSALVLYLPLIVAVLCVVMRKVPVAASPTLAEANR